LCWRFLDSTLEIFFENKGYLVNEKIHPLMAPVMDKIQGLSDHAIFVVPIIKKQNVIGASFLRTASPRK
jgi:hypothetical protein